MSTIAAIATGKALGGIAIVRVSGPDAKAILQSIFRSSSSNFSGFKPWVMHRGKVLGYDGLELDDVLAVFMPGIKTYTGEDIVEIHCHGGTTIVSAILENILRHGARQAEKGEFTRRAFLNNRMDLSQAEAVAEIISAPNIEAIRSSLKRLNGNLGTLSKTLSDKLNDLRALACVGIDFPDDEIESISREDFIERLEEIHNTIGSLLINAKRTGLREKGAKVILAGAVNSGKSSLLNIISGRERALVTAQAGTTRDFIEEQLDIEGIVVKLIDTAGLRNCEQKDVGFVEKLGIQQTKKLLEEADLILLVLDGASYDLNINYAVIDEISAQTLNNAGEKSVLLIWNKCDIKKPDSFPPLWAVKIPSIIVSAKTGENIELLIHKIRSLLEKKEVLNDNGLSPNERQALVLEKADQEILDLLNDLQLGQSYDCCLARLDTASAYINEIVALAPHSELLDKIFSQFCIGK